MGCIFSMEPRVVPASARTVETISAEQFCIADENGEYQKKLVLEGFTILLYDRATLLRDAAGNCIMGLITGTDMGAIFDPLAEEGAA